MFTLLAALAVIAIGLASFALVDQNGEIAFDPENTATNATATAIAETIAKPSAITDTYAGVVRKMLDNFTSAAGIIVDTVSRRIWGATGAQGNTLVDDSEIFADSQFDRVDFMPDSGQTGRALTWSRTNGSGALALSAPQLAAFDELVTATKTKRTVESLVSAIIASLDPALFPHGGAVMIDQTGGTVSLYSHTQAGSADAMLTKLAALPNSGDKVCIYFTEPAAAGSGESPLKFEGGAV